MAWLVADVQDRSGVLAGGGYLEEGAGGFGDAAAAADDLAHVGVGDVEVEDVTVAVPFFFDDDFVRAIDEGAGDVLDEFFHGVIVTSNR
jgi:hypothetical protein